jgi:hypothetical protein
MTIWLNQLVFTGAINNLWSKTAIRNYDPASYQTAFGVIIRFQVLELQ